MTRFIDDAAQPVVEADAIPGTGVMPDVHQPSTQNGLIIPPFPPKATVLARQLPSKMEKEEAEEELERVLAMVNDFDGYVSLCLNSKYLNLTTTHYTRHPPFTIQRVCELAVRPTDHYSTVGKYLRAFERSLLVTSTTEDYPTDLPAEDPDDRAFNSSVEANLKITNTPIFSPIPFLHDDARRAGSKSPPLSPLVLSNHLTPSESPPGEPRALGLVDELDDPSPGHMSDHPTELTSVPSENPPTTLQERFTPATTTSSPPPGDKKSEDDEVEDMVMDEPEQ